MIKLIFNKLLSTTGKSYTVDERIPQKLLLGTLFNRVIMMIRGILFLRKKVFLGSRCRISNKKNILWGSNVTIESNTIIDGYASEPIRFGNNVKIGAYSYVSCTSHFSKYGKGLKIGNDSAVGRFTEFGAAGGVIIGNNVIMGSYISFHSENHIFNDLTKPIREQGVTSEGIILGNNIWVGAKVTFLDGCKIGNNSVVAAGAVVRGEFPDNVVIGGVPAKILKKLN
ncbi:MAG: acyltransferase [Flavobacteriaceae bacterium]|jgi:acetyltransferase-like isoleucine patch superfamily enzyme|nr:acyltransferase [Flavobacteriaceae bacterium]